MLEGFLRYINEKALFNASDRLLLAVSGGIDSVVLVELCKQAKLNYAIAHCNFNLRGEESDADATSVATMAQHHQVSFHIQSFDTQTFAHKQGISTQMAARELRYQWFEQIRTQYHYDYLLTAHHQDDLLETILLNLTRGTGLAGLHGILPKNGNIVRPLLFATRVAIESFAQQNTLQWREDSSNSSTYYLRNKIRHEVVPILKDINPNISKASEQLANRIWATEQILQNIFTEKATEIVTHKQSIVYINIYVLEQQIAPVEYLAHYLAPYNFSYRQVEQIWQNRNQQIGKVYLSDTHRLTLDRHQWLIDIPTYEVKNTEINIAKAGFLKIPNLNLSWEYVAKKDIQFDSNPNVVYIDADLLQPNPLIRLWQEGDWFCPIGMSMKKKKISDLLIDNKVPRALKDYIYVLDNAENITWVIGVRLDERYKITQNTKNIIKFMKI